MIIKLTHVNNLPIWISILQIQYFTATSNPGGKTIIYFSESHWMYAQETPEEVEEKIKEVTE